MIERKTYAFTVFFMLPVYFFMLFAPALHCEDSSNSMGVPNLSLLGKESELRNEMQKKIQEDILDPMLGKGRALVFVTIELQVITKKSKMTRKGGGSSAKTNIGGNKLFSQSQYILPGIPKPKSLTEEPVEGRLQREEQEKGA
ncbi:hypothetical protein ACFL6Y_11790, partial [Elusimicrobiota bacterium]